jgi:hypothetical protein
MGARGRLAAFPVSLDVSLSEAQKYRLEAMAASRGDSLAGVVRHLIDKEWQCLSSTASSERGKGTTP